MATVPIDFDAFPVEPATRSPIDDCFPVVETMPVRTPEVLPAEPVTEEERVAQAALELVARAKAFEVTDPVSYEQAGRMIDQLKTKRKDVVGWFQPMVDAAHKAWKTLTERRGGLTDPLDEALAILSSRYATFARHERERADAERKRQEKEAQEGEQARLKAEAEEAQRLADEAAQAALTAPSREEAQVLEQQAESLQQQAEQTRVEAATVPAPVLPVHSRIDHVKGPTVAQNWTFEVTDKLALIKAVAAGHVSIEALEPNTSYLSKRAKADKATATIPGVRVYDAGSVRASRSRR